MQIRLFTFFPRLLVLRLSLKTDDAPNLSEWPVKGKWDSYRGQDVTLPLLFLSGERNISFVSLHGGLAVAWDRDKFLGQFRGIWRRPLLHVAGKPLAWLPFPTTH